MEKSLFDFEKPISIEKATSMSPIVLAFIGDAVYSLYVREKNAFTTDYKTGVLNDKTSLKVCAKAQAELADILVDSFTEQELAIFKRGRNAKKPSKSKSCSVVEYNKSTGLEAVIGYLYITGQRERINQLMENIK